MDMKKIVLFLMLVLPRPLMAEESFVVNPLLVNMAPATKLLVVKKDREEILSVSPEGVVKLKGVELDTLNTDEASVAWLALAKYMLAQNNAVDSRYYRELYDECMGRNKILEAGIQKIIDAGKDKRKK
jgi:hypothetical protein